MAEYIKKQELLNDTRIYKDDNGVVRTRKFVFRNYIESLPTADVVEREKIDKAIEEMKSLADPENTILGFDEKMGLKTAMNILVRNIGESK